MLTDTHQPREQWKNIKTGNLMTDIREPDVNNALRRQRHDPFDGSTVYGLASFISF